MVGVLEEICAIGERALEASDLCPVEPRFLIKLYSLMSVALGVDLARGVVRESRALSGGNAIRLARHLFETEICLAYVSDQPTVRIDQAFATDASKRLAIIDRVAELRVTRGARTKYEDIIESVNEQADTRSRVAGVPVKKLPPGERTRLPSYEDMANVLEEREVGWIEAYDLYYRGTSGIAHPTILAMQDHLSVDGPRIVFDSVPSRELRRAQMALALAIRALANLVHAAGLRIGYPVGPQLRDLVEYAGEPLRKGRSSAAR